MITDHSWIEGTSDENDRDDVGRNSSNFDGRLRGVRELLLHGHPPSGNYVKKIRAEKDHEKGCST